MKTMKILFCLMLVSLWVVSDVCAIDASICTSESNVVLHENGSLKSCQLQDGYEANNIQCSGFGTISFFDNGNLESCMLAASVTVGENNCREDFLISFYKDGKLKSCMKTND